MSENCRAVNNVPLPSLHYACTSAAHVRVVVVVVAAVELQAAPPAGAARLPVYNAPGTRQPQQQALWGRSSRRRQCAFLRECERAERFIFLPLYNDRYAILSEFSVSILAHFLLE